MSVTNSAKQQGGASAVEADDYALDRVPRSARYSWFSVAVQRFGQLSSLTSFLLGATLGYGMTFWESFLAITLGSVILEVVCIFTGIMGMREGLNTSLLARWTGFGSAGAATMGAAIAVSAIGWFGIQSGVSGAGLHQLIPAVPAWGWCLIFGLAITLVVAFGFRAMQWVANVTVPIFMILVGWAIITELAKHGLPDLMNSAPAGPRLSLIAGTTVVAGGFIVGAIITPDQTRYNRSVGDVVKQTVVSVTLGEYLIGLSGVLLAHAIKSSDVTAIVMSSVGWVGVLVLVLGTVKINDWNLYSASLGVVNFIGSVFSRRVNRVIVTIAIGVIGTVLAAVGILDKLVSFLTILSVVFPPIAGVFIAEYFFVKQWRGVLEESRATGKLPQHAPIWVPITLVIWAVSAVFAYFVPWGIPSINSLVLAFVLYFVAGKLGWIRGVGQTMALDSVASTPQAEYEATK